MLRKYLGLRCLTQDSFPGSAHLPVAPWTPFFPGCPRQWEAAGLAGLPARGFSTPHYPHLGRGSLSCATQDIQQPSLRDDIQNCPQCQTRPAGRTGGGQTPRLRCRDIGDHPRSSQPTKYSGHLVAGLRSSKDSGSLDPGKGVQYPHRAGLKPWHRLPFPLAGNAARLSLPL